MDDKNYNEIGFHTEDEEIVDYSNYTPTEPKEEDEDANDDDLVDEDKLYK